VYDPAGIVGLSLIAKTYLRDTAQIKQLSPSQTKALKGIVRTAKSVGGGKHLACLNANEFPDSGLKDFSSERR
jgi:hypothetical protein